MVQRPSPRKRGHGGMADVNGSTVGTTGRGARKRIKGRVSR